MEPLTIVAIILVLFLVLLVIEMPVALALAGSGFLGVVLLGTFDIGMSTLAGQPFAAVSNYSYSIIPLYILLGMFALQGGLASRLFSIAAVALRKVPGGLGIATVGACAGFAAVSGSSLATAASVGKLSVAEMQRYGYPSSLAAGIVAMAGTLGILIPPSVVLALYGVVSGESIAQLLVAGLVPGLLFALIIAGTVIVMVLRLRPALVGTESGSSNLHEVLSTAAHSSGTRPGSSDQNPEVPLSAAERKAIDEVPEQDEEEWTAWSKIRAVGWILGIFTIILLGVFTGWFTVMESAAFGAALALIMLVVERWKSGIVATFGKFRDALVETASVASMALGLVMGASIFTFFLVTARVPIMISEAITGLDVPPMLIVAIILIALIPLGMFLEGLSMMIIVVPLIHPVVVEMGLDGIWFAILFVIMLEIGMVTPPVGINCFVVSSATGVPLVSVFKGVLPFIGSAMILVAILMIFPDIVTWLPAAVVE